MPAAERAELRGLLVVALCLVVSLGFAVLGGATAIGRDLALRRMGFWYARPLPGPAIWAAKLGAVMALVLLALPLLLGPVLLLDGSEQMRLPGGGPLAGLLLQVVLGAALLVPLAHAAGVSLRSRSGWLLVEAGALLGFGLGCWMVVGELLVQVGDRTERIRLLWPHVVAIAAVPVLTSAFAVVLGRAELRRVHAAQAFTLCGLLALNLLVLTSRMRWIFSAEPRHLQALSWVRPAPSGRWIEIAGWARDAWQTWLLDAASGRSVRAGPFVTFSADGQVAAWIEPDTLEPPFPGELRRLRLDGRAAPLASGLRLAASATIALSPDGSRLAAVDGDLVQVVELESGRLLLAGRLPEGGGGVSILAFTGNDRIFLLQGRSAGRDHFAIDIAAKRLTWSGVSGPMGIVAAAPGHDRLLAFEGDAATALVILEAASGLELWRHDLPLREWDVSAGFVSGGRVVVCAPHAGRVRLLVFAGDGCLERDSILAIWSPRARFAGEPAPGQALLAVGFPPKSILVDLASGALLRREEGLRPARDLGWRSGFEALAAGAPGARLFRSGANDLVELDLASGARRTVLAMQSREE